MKNNRGSNRTAGAPALPGAGRPAIKATIREGDGLMLSHVAVDGTADLGRGRATIEKIGNARIVKVALGDGSEIRILVIHD